MKKSLLVLVAFVAFEFNAQSQTYLMGTYWTGSSEMSAHLNTSTGAVTTLTSLTGVNYLAQGVTAYDPNNNVYYDYTDLGNPGQVITKTDVETGMLLGTITTPYFIKAIEYNSNTGNLVGTYWSGSIEVFCSLDPTTGALNTISQLSSTSFAQGESTFDAANNRYFIKSNLGIEMIDASSGVVLDIFDPQGLKGIEYDSNTGELIGTYWTGSQEIFASMDLTTGNISIVNVLTGVSSLVQGESAFDAAGNRYFNITNTGITTIDVATGNIISTIQSNLKGLEYIGTATPECTVTPTFISPAEFFGQRGSDVTLKVLSQAGVNYQWQSNPNNFGWMNIPSNENYSGSNTPALTVKQLSLGNHLQPFRVIASKGNCVETSLVSYIHISDTCVAISSDTLVMSFRAGGARVNTEIRVYPNPTNDYIVVEVGDPRITLGYSVRLVNTLGSEIYHEPINGVQMKIDLSAVNSRGVYLIQILDRDEKTVESRRIIVR
jgi:hypothetical protein